MKCEAVPVIKVTMRIGWVEPNGGDMQVSEGEDGRGFCIFIPKRVFQAKGFAVGHEIDVLVVPSDGLMSAREILAISHRETPDGFTRAAVFTKGDLWTNLITNL